ncbi:hypothetical protein BJF78_04265 [Pseudonocardia sp. CNS-139]|nr:hypothetical protein BJF78_04265 [Pseudonocardia sp. CNS-139]
MPLAEHLGPVRPYLDELIDRHPGGALRVLPTPVRYEFAANWKVSWDNAADGIHATFAHRSYNLLGKEAETDTVLARNPAATPMVSRAFPRGHSVVDQRPGIPDGPWATMRPLPTSDELVAALQERGESHLLDLATGSMLNVNVFPNLIFVGNQLMVVEPVAVDRTRVTMYLVLAPGAPEEVDLLRLRVDEDFVSFGTPDDLEMFERVQTGLAIEEDEWIDTSRGAALDVVEQNGADDGADDGGTAVEEAARRYGEIVRGDIATEAPVRGYLREWTRLMTEPAELTGRRGVPERERV